MRRVRIALLLLLAACQGEKGTGPELASRIEVSPGEVTLLAAGATQRFSAQAEDGNGSTVPGVSVTWRSSNAAVLRVDATGLATAVAEGDAAVIAQSGGASGQADVTVDIPTCVQPQLVQLSPGQMLVSDPPASASCALTLPAGNAGDRYRVAIVRLTSAVDAGSTTATLTLAPRGGVVADAPPRILAPALAPLFGPREAALLERSAAVADETARAHLRLRAAEEELLRRVGPLRPSVPRLLASPDGPMKVSPSQRTFSARTSSETSCTAKPAVNGVLVAQNSDIAVYQESAQAQAKPLAAAHVQRLLDFFTRFGRSTIESHFGAIPDRDRNGQVVVFATLFDSTSVSVSVAAFVWGGDQLAKVSCPASNEMELVYFNSDLINLMGSGNYQALETLVHEVKHVVSFNQRITGVSFSLHPAWMEEGTAEIAGEVASRRAWAAAVPAGPPENGVVTRQSFAASGSKFTPENYGVGLRIFRTVQYLSTQPNAVVAAPPSGYSIYGSGWHFHRFLGDGFGGAASAPGAAGGFFRLQNAGGTPAGLAGLPVITGKKFTALLVDYAAAIMLNGTGAPPPARAFTTYDFLSATTFVSGIPAAPYPYPVTAVGSNPSASFAVSRSWQGLIGNAGLRIHDFVSNGTGTGADITVQVEHPARVVVVRLR